MSLIEQLRQDGFVIAEILDAEAVQYLNKLCTQYLSVTPGTDFISSSHFLSQADSDFINDELHRIIGPKIQQLFPELELMGGTLATKIKGASVLEAHQDWSIVDETRFASYNLWLPIVDTNQQNGTLGIIKGSHTWNKELRGLNIPNPYGKFTGKFLKVGLEPDLKAGQGILYDHRLIHYSRPNKTDNRRNVAILGIKDKGAALRVSFLQEDKIETYTAQQSDFYLFDVNHIMSKNQHLYTLPNRKLNYKWRDLEKLMKIRKFLWFSL